MTERKGRSLDEVVVGQVWLLWAWPDDAHVADQQGVSDILCKRHCG